MGSGTGPLEGLRALEIGDRGEFAGKWLADAGVDVLRVEPPGGARSRHSGPFVADRPDPDQSLHYHALNTSKRAVTLDVRTSEGLDLWRRLVDGVDIVLDSMVTEQGTPAALEALGGGYAAFEADQPRVVWCSITPFGLTGPRRDWLVTDLVSMALGGPPMSTGYDDHDLPPVRSDGEHSLALAGEYAVSATLAAILQRDLQREGTGRGQLLDLSIHEAVSATTEGAFANWEYFGRLVQRQTGRHSAPRPTAPWQFQTADGHHVMLMGGGIPRTMAIWDRLMEWLGEHDAAEDLNQPGQGEVIFTDPVAGAEQRSHVTEVLGRFVSTLPAEEVYRRAQQIRLPWGFVRRPEDNLDDPHWADRAFYQPAAVHGHPQDVRYVGPPYRFTGSPAGVRSRPPLLGEHNAQVYGAVGVSSTELARLAAAGVI